MLLSISLQNFNCKDKMNGVQKSSTVILFNLKLWRSLIRIFTDVVMCGFTTDFHVIRHGFSHYCVYQCQVLCYLCLLWWCGGYKRVIINLSEAVWRFIGVGVADFVKLSVIICERLNNQRVIISISEAVLRFRSGDSLILGILFLKISQIYILFYCLCHLVEMEVGGGG